MPLPPHHKSRRLSLHDHVVHELGTRIVSGELKPTEVLPREEVLAAQMKVSRTALREAIKVLGAKGLIESRPKIGTRIREERYWSQLDAEVLAWRCASIPTGEFARTLLQMREIIEPAAAALAAQHASTTQRKAIERALAAMAAATDISQWTAADVAFHEAILQATHNPLLGSLFAVIETALTAYFMISARSAKNFKYSLPYHQQVFEAISKRQPDKARKVMLQMIADSNANVLSAARASGRRPSGS